MTDLVNKFMAFADEMMNNRRIVLTASMMFDVFCAAHQLDVQKMTSLRAQLEGKGIL